MKILITGARGFIGGRLSYHLQKRHQVIKASRNKYNGFKLINWNSTENLKKLTKGVDVVINCTGFDVHGSKKFKLTKKVNTNFPYKLYKISNSSNVKLFIFLSTYHVYKNNYKKKINEKSKTSKKNLYTLSKIKGEKKIISIKEKKTKILIIRSCNLFGYPKYKNKNCWRLFINSIIQDLIVRNKFILNSKINNFRVYSSMTSFCIFISKILSKYSFLKFNKKIMVINYLSKKNLNLIQVISLILTKIRKKNLKIFFKHKKLHQAKRIKYSSLYQNKIYNLDDKFFNHEIMKTISYVKKNFKNS